jgi:SAM-dependent methyltransferase
MGRVDVSGMVGLREAQGARCIVIRCIPWWAKLVAKIVLSRLPFDYRRWAALGLFKHGGMADPEYALDVFRAHFDRAEFPAKRHGFTCLELGPGDSLASAPIAYAFGAVCCYLVDSGDYACRDTAPLQGLLELLASRGKDISDLRDAKDWEDVLSRCNARYLVGGMDALSGIPNGAVDFVWSQAVLEHVRKRDFAKTMQELRRILSPGGCCSHTVDLTDHFNGQLNNLRFSAALWESPLFANSGFYTNRIRFGEMMQIFESAGFEVVRISIRTWERLPTARRLLDAGFSMLPDKDLLTYGFDVVLR